MTMTGLFNNGFGGMLPAVGVSGGINYDTGGFSLDTGYFPWNNANPTYTYQGSDEQDHRRSQSVSSASISCGAQKNEQNSPYVQGILGFDNTIARKHRQCLRGHADRSDCVLLADQSPNANTTTATRSWSRTSRTTGT